MNVLVFPCGSEIGLEVYRSLRFSTHFNLYGASSVSDHGEAVYENYIGGIPSVGDEGFIDALNDLVNKYNIDFIYPAHDSVVLALAEAKASNMVQAKVIASPVETCRIARSKSDTYKTLHSIIPTPQVFPRGNPPLNFPVFAKPVVGQGSKGARIVNNQSDLRAVYELDEDMVVCEYLPGEEYTIDCFTDKNGKLRYVQGRDRSRTSNGISVHSSTVDGDEFNEIAKKINDTLNFRGGWFFQLKRAKEGELKLLEIATRIAGTSGVSRALGVNLPLLSLFDANDYDVEIYKNEYHVTVDRALYNTFKLGVGYQHIYIDFDDLIINGENVNTAVIAFLYESRNKGKTIHLLTRHKKDIYESLKQISLSPHLFHHIQLVLPADKKSKYIIEKDAIFIDDSFAERHDVYNVTGIPTFDAHMIEALVA